MFLSNPQVDSQKEKQYARAFKRVQDPTRPSGTYFSNLQEAPQGTEEDMMQTKECLAMINVLSELKQRNTCKCVTFGFGPWTRRNYEGNRRVSLRFLRVLHVSDVWAGEICSFTFDAGLPCHDV